MLNLCLHERISIRNVAGVTPANLRKYLLKLLCSVKPKARDIILTEQSPHANKRLASRIIRASI